MLDHEVPPDGDGIEMGNIPNGTSSANAEETDEAMANKPDEPMNNLPPDEITDNEIEPLAETPTENYFKELICKYGLPIRTLQRMGAEFRFMGSIDSFMNNPSITSSMRFLSSQNCEGAMLRGFAVMRQLVVLAPKRPEGSNQAPTAEMPALANFSFTKQDDEEQADLAVSDEQESGDATVVWKQDVNDVIDAMFEDKENAVAWKKEIIAKLFKFTADSIGVAPLEQRCCRIEIITAYLSEGSQRFLNLCA